jgi:choline transport protein
MNNRLTHLRAPTAGGQYHWVSEFAPTKYQKILSYYAGWLAVLSWQACTASGGFFVGGIIQSMAQLSHANYNATDW